MNKLKMLVLTGLAAFSLAAAGAASAQLNIGSQSTGAGAGRVTFNVGSQSTRIGAGKITFNPFSITRKPPAAR